MRSVTLSNGQEMRIQMATEADASHIGDLHALPREARLSEDLYRGYYEAKSLLYVRAPVAGILTGCVGDQLAGFLFHCEDQPAFKAFARSPRSILWLLKEVAFGRFGFRPSFWVQCLRWALQHFRQPEEYHEFSSLPGEDIPTVTSWVETTHTAEEFRRLGVASALFAEVEELLSQRGVTEVAGWVAVDNEPAVNMLGKMHYRRVARVERTGESCWLMVKSLREGAPS